jgi:uncharacterized protein (DUF2384 family)
MNALEDYVHKIQWEDFDRVFEELKEWYTVEEAVAWLTTPQLLLDGKRPIDSIVLGSVESVLKVLRTMDEGVYI